MAKSLENDPTDPDNRIAFLHIGKNAGTQIVFLAQQLAARGINIVKTPHQVKLGGLGKDMPYFFSIRNPLTRFRSGFYSRKRKGQPRYLVEWSIFERIAFEKFEHANALAEALFRDDELGRDAIRAITSIGHTSMQQIDWFSKCLDFEVRPPLWIIRQENLVEDFKTFLRKLNANVDIEDLEFAVDARSAHKNDYGAVPELSDLARKNLEIWYARDFAFYNLCVDWMKRNSETPAL